MKSHFILSALAQILFVLASDRVASGQPVATHRAGATYTAGASLGVTNTFSFSGQLWSLLWRPHLPAGWTLVSVSGTGNPELQSGEIVWTGSMPASPIQLQYLVQVPALASGIHTVRGEVEYLLAGMVNPATIWATPDPLTVSNAPLVRLLTVASRNPGSGVPIQVSPADNHGAGDGTTEFSRQYNHGTLVTLSAAGSAGGNTFQHWERDGATVSSNLSTTVLMDANQVMSAVYAAGVIVTHDTFGVYAPGTIIGVTNTFSYTGQLLSLLWRPHLSNGWTVVSASGTGNPELLGGEIVWTGTMPASPIRMAYRVQVPAGASGAYAVRGEVEYQLAGMVNPVTVYASPDPLVLPKPKLLIALNPSLQRIVISWTNSAFTWRLMETSQLLTPPPSTWTPVATSPLPAGNLLQVTLPLPVAGTRFYRLEFP